MSDDPLEVRFEMRSSQRWIDAVDEWRRRHAPALKRAEVTPIDPAKTFAHNDLHGIVEIEWHKRAGGGGA